MDQTDVGLKSVVKALTDTIAGAIDPADHLAREQLRLAASYVDFVRQRLDFIHARERYDLKHYVSLARQLLSIGLPPDMVTIAELRLHLDAAEALLGDPDARTDRTRATAMELAHAVSRIVQEAHQTSGQHSAAVDRAVLSASEEKLEMERIWYQPVGFDPAPPVGVRLEDRLK
ncbi:hypothetical protein [Mesorhizobium sp. L-8-3]|uniref:hypothetical protein n=1 Tax=Mesorhizobium sp. L-8-3 TaxID=2744522 RepID=UPI001928D7EB|nr:hypothetical protein [Mesorhizobium sp. L-8-3]BCH23422.1 hypothetical protein MesoLjLb_32070 [Mesorhizobium sp. L-8-3]